MEKACPGLVVDYFGGQCPVQAWGTLLGFPFYFRARHAHWSFAVAKVGEDPTMDGVPPLLFERVERWGKGEFDAGYMLEDVAWKFIVQSARAFVDAR